MLSPPISSGFVDDAAAAWQPAVTASRHQKIVVVPFVDDVSPRGGDRTVTAAWRDVIYKGDDNYFLMATSSNSGLPGGCGIVDEPARDRWRQHFRAVLPGGDRRSPRLQRGPDAHAGPGGYEQRHREHGS